MMIRGKNQIYCSRCNVLKKKCKNPLFNDICFPCSRTILLHKDKMSYLNNGHVSEGCSVGTVPTAVETVDSSLSSVKVANMDTCCSVGSLHTGSDFSQGEDKGGSVRKEIVWCDSVDSVDSLKESADEISAQSDDSSRFSDVGEPMECDKFRFESDGEAIIGEISFLPVGEDSDHHEVCQNESDKEIKSEKHTKCFRFCCNCFREELEEVFCVEDMDEYKVILSSVPSSHVNFRVKKGRLIKKSGVGESLLLCMECQSILRDDRVSVDERRSWKFQWPAYFWQLFIGSYDGTSVLRGQCCVKYCPSQLLKYWARNLIEEAGVDVKLLQHYMPSNDHEFLRSFVPDLLFLENPKKPIIVLDVTKDHREFTRITKELKLGALKHACNKYLIPRILCPWGCTAYLHRVGFLNYDAVINRFLPHVKCVGSQSKGKERINTQSCRGDFFSDVIDCHLHNPEWSIHPSVVYKSGFGPVFLTCLDHHGGTDLKYFHIPKTGSCLPQAAPESLSHAVLNARTIKASRAHLYSNSYQLQKCTATYSGLDSCYVSDHRYFDKTSLLCGHNEYRSYFGREDIRGLANRLCRHGVISESLVEDFKQKCEFFENSDFFSGEYVSGGSMMTLIDCMKLQKMLSESQMMFLGGDGCATENVLEIHRLWCPYLFQIHPNDHFGACVSNVGFYSSGGKELRIVWGVCLMLCNIAEMWEMVDKKVSLSSWEGFFLAYCAKKILRQRIPKVTYDHPFSVEKCVGTSTKKRSVDPSSLLQCLPSGVRGLSSSYLRVLFGNYEGVSIYPIPENLTEEAIRESVSQDLGSSVTILIFCKDLNSSFDNVEVIDHFYVDDNVFELRMVLCTNERVKKAQKRSESGKVEETEDSFKIKVMWDGCTFARHGTEAFPFWWRMNRGKDPFHCGDLSSVDWNMVDCLVYVRKSKMALDVARTEYLKYIGGQNKASCAIHDIPLIITASSKGPNLRRCFVKDGCENVEKYYCPVLNCDSRICHKCFTSYSSAFCVSPESLSQQATGDDDPIEERESVDEQSEEEGSLSLCSSSDSSSSNELQFDIGNLHTGEGLPIEDIEDCETICSGDDMDFENPYPTTHCAGRPITFDGSFGYMGSSVLLNKCGTMLVRRHTQLQASRRERNILERVVSVDDIGTVPLLYLEGMLFPSIFWSLPYSSDGGILGSIPTPLFCRHETRLQLKVASIADHMKTRLKSAGSHVATDPRYLSFAFDCLANGALQGNDTRVVLSRGFEESMGPAGLRMRNKEDDFYTDTIDNRQNVHNLAASEKECPSTYFLTLTCNQREHFGIKNVKQYSDSHSAITNYKNFLMTHYPFQKDLTEKSEVEVTKAFQEAARNLIVRNWFEVRLLLIDYLSHSPENPFGCPVKKIFVRDEYQADVGNLSHLHMLIATDQTYDNDKDRFGIQNCVRSIVDEIVAVDEVENLIAEGVLDDWTDYDTMREQARTFLPHIHSPRCMRRTGPMEKDVKCRVPDPRLSSGDTSNFFELKIDIQHSEESLRIMERLGLCEDRNLNGGLFVPNHDFLKAKRILPPVKAHEGNISPVLGRIFAATRSASNIQICTSFGTSRYVVKYLIKIDENNYVVLSSNSKNGQITHAERVHLNNTKITSSAINEKKKLNSGRHRHKPKGRQISSTEQMQLILGYPQIHTNVECIKVCTLPLAERAGIERTAPINSAAVESNQNITCPHDAFEFCVPAVKCREVLFPNCQWRRHSASQIVMLQDQMNSPVSLDKVFYFGIRPPELLIFDKLEWYFRFFERCEKRVVEDSSDFYEIVNEKLELSQLIDGLGHRIKLRSGAFSELMLILEDDAFVHNCHLSGSDKMRTLFVEICTLGLSCNELLRASFCRYRWLKDLYVYDQEMLPIPVFSNVKPLNSQRFIIHLLLSMGHFHTEVDLWTNAAISDTFVNARLIRTKTIDQVDELLRRWIVEQLRFYPIGSKKMDEFIVSAYGILYAAIMENNFPMNELPPFLYTTLAEECSDKIVNFLRESKNTLIETTLTSLRQVYNSDIVLPSVSDLQSASKSNPFDWNCVFPRSERQSLESYNEQESLSNDIKQIVQKYIQTQSHVPKNYILCGPPGSGKTHCMSQCILYCLSKGLTCVTTAILADRAFVLGGKHVHKLFALKVRDSGTPHRLAELAVIALQKNPEMISFLRQLDVLFFDELGQLSAEQVAILDLIMRRIRDSNLFMGGLLIIGTLDQHQLRPIKGLPFLLSPFILTSFLVGRLNHYVRCSDCPCLQEMNTIARTFLTDRNEWEDLLRRFKTLLENCTYVQDWSDSQITDDVIRIFPRKFQTSAATKAFVEKKVGRLREGVDYLIAKADDFMNAFESHGDWSPANESSRQYLNAKCKEPENLHIYVGAIYQFTYNKPGFFNATQLGVVMDLPSPTDVLGFKDFEIFVAPPGCKYANITADTTKLKLIADGWKVSKMSTAPQYSLTIWNKGVKVRRKQYGMKIHVSSTIHSAIGNSLGKVACSLDYKGQLWERAMVVVLISRVSYAKDLIFVGSKQDNIKALIDGLRVRDQYAEYMNHLVDVLVSDTSSTMLSTPIRLSNHPFRPKDVQLPRRNEGVVYFLVSARDQSAMYIGQTLNLAKRLKQHNSGFGSRESSDPSKRPWALFAYVTGFIHDKHLMRLFERNWQDLVRFRRPSDPAGGLRLGVTLLNERFKGEGLHIVSCAE